MNQHPSFQYRYRIWRCPAGCPKLWSVDEFNWDTRIELALAVAGHLRGVHGDEVGAVRLQRFLVEANQERQTRGQRGAR